MHVFVIIIIIGVVLVDAMFYEILAEVLRNAL